jgi:23S rRNA (adenine2503-C2)-methyltransferase
MGERVLAGKTLEELEALAEGLGEPRWRGGQMARWVYEKRVKDLEAMTDLPGAMRGRLAEEGWAVRSAGVAAEQASRDGTRKMLVRLADGEEVEMVLIPSGGRLTLCASTQVGCPAGCVFCATGQGGLVRDMTAGEIVEEMLLAEDAAEAEEAGRVTNLVVMGMGEPLLNYESVVKAVRVINAPWGLGLGARSITVSTVGLPEAIDRLAGEGLQVTLAISLHAMDDETRSRMVPMNKKTGGVEALLDAARRYFERTGREVTFEVVLVRGVNCSKRRARTMAEQLRGLRCNVNVIPVNRAARGEWESPSPPEVDTFVATLRRHGVNVHLRRRRGADIDAACGQLRARRDLTEGAS